MNFLRVVIDIACVCLCLCACVHDPTSNQSFADRLIICVISCKERVMKGS